MPRVYVVDSASPESGTDTSTSIAATAAITVAATPSEEAARGGDGTVVEEGDVSDLAVVLQVQDKQGGVAILVADV